MDAYGQFFRSVLFPAWETRLRHRPTLQHLAYLERTQWCSADELVAIQLGGLRRLLGHAYENVPFHRRRFDAAGIVPTDIKSLDDLLRLPLLTRQEANASVDARRSTVPPFPEVSKTTSGSSGVPLVFGYDWGSEHWRQAVKYRGYGWAGYRLGERTIHYWGPSAIPNSMAKRAKLALDHTLRRDTYLDCTRRDDAYMRQVVDTIRREQPNAIICFAQSAGFLARYINAHGLRDWGNIPVICGAEQLFPQDREALEQAFGKNVFETYGSREVMLMGAECPAHAGLHLSMENLVVEIVVTEPGGKQRHARPGEQGEVVVTDLHNFGMPFVRYVNGDLATAGPDARCACGRALRRLAAIEGRKSDTLRDASGNEVAGLLINVIMTPIAHTYREFQCVQHKDRSITFKVVTTDRYTPEVESQLRDSLAARISGVPIKIERVDDIPAATSGKRRPVVVEQ